MFKFKQFTIHQDRCAMKVTTDACLFGGWLTNEIQNSIPTTIGTQIQDILDIGTGTGLLALMCAQKNLSSNIDAVEIDKGAFTQATENIAASSFSERVKVIHEDVKKIVFSKKYDFIVSNPPFYEKEVRSNNDKKNIARHHSGLLFEELLEIIKTNLSSSGRFYLLLPFKRNEEIKKILLKKDLFVSKIVFTKQSPGHGYFRMMIEGNLNHEGDAETRIEEISIWDHQQQYTNEFKDLLKDYYLYL